MGGNALYRQGMGTLFALTIPGLVVGLIVVAAIDQVLYRLGRKGLLPWRHSGRASAAGMDPLSAVLTPGKQHELDQKHQQALMREDEGDAAPPHSSVDIGAGIARILLPPS
jgi:hypothetical protein